MYANCMYAKLYKLYKNNYSIDIQTVKCVLLFIEYVTITGEKRKECKI